MTMPLIKDYLTREDLRELAQQAPEDPEAEPCTPCDVAAAADAALTICDDYPDTPCQPLYSIAETGGEYTDWLERLQETVQLCDDVETGACAAIRLLHDGITGEDSATH